MRRNSFLNIVRSTFSTWLILFCLCLALKASAAPDKSAGTFRVMTYNIHHGEGVDGRIDLERIAALIKREKADIVGLQEVDRGVLRTGRRDLPAELSKLTGMSVVFENNRHYQGGEYGNAVLTRFPIIHATNTLYKMPEPNEQRGVLQLVLWLNDQRLLFMDTHLNYRAEAEAEREAHVETLKGMIADYKMPAIVCGDFNSSPGAPNHVSMKKSMRDTWQLVGQGKGFTIPTEHPNNRIDYIWISKEVQPVRSWVPKSAASDHLPVMAEFRLVSPTAPAEPVRNRHE